MRKRYVKRPEDEAKMQGASRAVEKKQLPHMLCVTNMLLHGIEDPSFVRHGLLTVVTETLRVGGPTVKVRTALRGPYSKTR